MEKELEKAPSNVELCAAEIDEVLKKYGCTFIHQIKMQESQSLGRLVYVPEVEMQIVEVKK